MAFSVLCAKYQAIKYFLNIRIFSFKKMFLGFVYDAATALGELTNAETKYHLCVLFYNYNFLQS